MAIGGDQVRISWQPEPLGELKARAPEAIRRLWTFTEGLAIASDHTGEVDRAAMHRTHVFDFAQDWVRLIISRDEVRPGEVYIHVSGSPNPGMPAAMRATLVKAARAVGPLRAGVAMVQTFAELLLPLHDRHAVAMTEGFVPHVWFDIKPPISEWITQWALDLMSVPK